jgi:hypothetical protein
MSRARWCARRAALRAHRRAESGEQSGRGGARGPAMRLASAALFPPCDAEGCAGHVLVRDHQANFSFPPGRQAEMRPAIAGLRAGRPEFSLETTILNGFAWLFPARLETSLCPRYAGRSRDYGSRPWHAPEGSIRTVKCNVSMPPAAMRGCASSSFLRCR